jgi:hypothetical protein
MPYQSLLLKENDVVAHKDNFAGGLQSGRRTRQESSGSLREQNN